MISNITAYIHKFSLQIILCKTNIPTAYTQKKQNKLQKSDKAIIPLPIHGCYIKYRKKRSNLSFLCYFLLFNIDAFSTNHFRTTV